MEDKIICLVGTSGSGKTTLAKELEKEGYNIIHSYTTRKPREEGEWGHTFIDDFEMDGKDIISFDAGIQYYQENMIAFKELYSYVYFATKEQYQGKGTSIYIVDPQGAEMVKENVKDAEVITIFLMADRESRLWMMKGQGRKRSEAHDRLERDEELFKTCKCDYVVDANREVEEVLKDVVSIIE